jgi:hypothetical protein
MRDINLSRFKSLPDVQLYQHLQHDKTPNSNPILQSAGTTMFSPEEVWQTPKLQSERSRGWVLYVRSSSRPNVCELDISHTTAFLLTLVDRMEVRNRMLCLQPVNANEGCRSEAKD